MKRTEYRKGTNPDQDRCLAVLAELAGGEHHLFGVQTWGPGLAVEWTGDFSTFDFDTMTRAVILAHKHAVRLGVNGGKRERVVLIAHARKPGDASTQEIGFSQRHPTLHHLAGLVQQQIGGQSRE